MAGARAPCAGGRVCVRCRVAGIRRARCIINANHSSRRFQSYAGVLRSLKRAIPNRASLLADDPVRAAEEIIGGRQLGRYQYHQQRHSGRPYLCRRVYKSSSWICAGLHQPGYRHFCWAFTAAIYSELLRCATYRRAWDHQTVPRGRTRPIRDRRRCSSDVPVSCWCVFLRRCVADALDHICKARSRNKTCPAGRSLTRAMEPTASQRYAQISLLMNTACNSRGG